MGLWTWSLQRYIQFDGYTVYMAVAKSAYGIRLTDCMENIQRKFFEAKNHQPQAAEYASREKATGIHRSGNTDRI